jgi:hypothetical protein
VRTDSDGDGLSDRWEKFNGRDPGDGKLQFEFDCGGWQTEGWESDGGLTNIAGRQGFLDFNLLTEVASISRDGLKIDAGKNKGKFALRLRSSGATELKVVANGEALGSTEFSKNEQFTTIEIPLGDSWTGIIKSLQLSFSAPKDSTIEVDWIRVQ